MRSMMLPVALFAITIGVEDRALAATMRLKAVAINDASIEPSNHVTVSPNDIITVEAFVTGWNEDVPGSRLSTYQFTVDGANSYFSGDSGRLLLRGVDAPSDYHPCDVNSDCQEEAVCHKGRCRIPCHPIYEGEKCPELFPLCHVTEQCVGLNHHPDDFAFINQTRPDYVHHEYLPALQAARTSFIDYAFGSVSISLDGPQVGEIEWYMGEWELIASSDACGAFTVRLIDDRMGLYTFLEVRIVNFGAILVYPDLEPLVIDVSCPPIAACCVPRQDCVDRTQTDCLGRGGTWQQNHLCGQGAQQCPRLPNIRNPAISREHKLSR